MSFFKHRPIFFALIAATIFSVGLLPQLPPWWLVITLASIIPILIYRRQWRSACLILALIYGIGYGNFLLARQLPVALDNQLFLLTGTVKGLPQHDELKQYFQLELESLKSLDNQVLPHTMSGFVRLSWYHSSEYEHQLVKPGQRWQLTVKLRRPRGFVNPAGFDYQVYLIAQGVVAIGYVKSSDLNRLLMQNTGSSRIDQWRDHFRGQFTDWHQQASVLGLLLALTIGERTLITVDQWELLRDTGTIHLMAISGLHISLAAIVGFLAGLFCSRFYQLFFPSSVVNYCFPALFSMMTALVYGLLAGMSLPTQRALIMVLIFHIATIFYRSASPWLLLSIALLFIAIHDPLAIYSQGFWLSFLAVALLLYGFIGRLSIRVNDAHIDNKTQSTVSNKFILYLKQSSVLFGQRLKALLWSQWLLMLGLVIPSIFWLQGISVSSPLANIIAVPYISILVVPLLLFTVVLSSLVPSWAHKIYLFTEDVLVFLVELLQMINHISPGFVLLPIGKLSWMTLLLGGVAVIWLLSPRGVPYRYLSLLLLLPIFFSDRDKPNLSLTFLDVGQGTAVVVETPNNLLVYDAGPSFGTRFNAGAHIIAPYLRYRGYESIDRLIVSHADKDHAGGVTGLLNTIDVDRISGGEPLAIDQQVFGCSHGEYWQWNDVHFSILWPPVNKIEQETTQQKISQKDVNLQKTIVSDSTFSGNNASCVLMIKYKNHIILLAGDIESEVEKKLLATGLLPEQVTILLVPHHGSLSSSLPDWVDRLSPEWAIVTAGYNNRYRHPHQTVVHRYLQYGARVLNTSEQGAIQFIVDQNNQWQVSSWRQKHRRYWYAQ